MAIPTPSFFKIRLSILIIGFLVVCFLVGVVKDVFASIEVVAWKGGESIANSLTSCRTLSIGSNGMLVVSSTNTYCGNGNPVYWVKISSVNFGTDCSIIANTSQYSSTVLRSNADSVITKWVNTESESGYPYTGVCDLCADKAIVLSETCEGAQGEAWEWTDEANCIGKCIDPCVEGDVGWKLVQSNQDISSQLTGRKCQEFTENTYCISDITVPEAWCVEFSDGTTCYHRQKLINTGESCPENQDGQGVPDKEEPPNKCASEIDALALQCGGTLNIKNFNTETCQGECVKQKCSAGYAALVARCGSFMQVATWDDYTCTGTCSNDPIDPVQKDPEKQTPEEDPIIDPEDTEGKITNKLLDTIKGNIDKQISQGNDQNNLLANIDKNIASGAKNQANINEKLGTGLEGIGKGLKGLGSAIDGIGDDISGLEGAIDGLGDEIGQINEGSFAEPTAQDPYSTEEEYDFGVRTTEFLNSMRSTSLFSIPNSLSSSIPGGGSSTLVIQTGDTFGGDHTIDFNWLSTGLTILKYIFQIAGMAIGIRIVTLHR